jgi:uncharacterized membrane protein
MAYDPDGSTTAPGMVAAGFGVLARQWPVLLAMGLITAALQTVQKIEGARMFGGPLVGALMTFALLIAQFVVTLVLMRMILSYEELVDEDTPIRFVTYLGLSIVMGLGEAVGYVLFVIPGIILQMRWFLAGNFVLARNMGVVEALDASRDATAGHRWAIFGALFLTGLIALIPLLFVVIAAGGVIAYTRLPWDSVLGLTSTVLLVVFGSLTNAMSIAIYAVLSGNTDRYEQVFA